MRWAWLLLWACGDTPDVDKLDPIRDPPGDTDGPGPDTDGPDTDEPEGPGPRETDAPRETDTDVEHTDLPVDTYVPGPPPTLGRGFVDLTAPLYTTWPRDVFPGDRPSVNQPDLTHAHLVDLDGDGWPEVVLVGTGAAPGAPRTLQALRYDRVTEALVPDAGLTAALSGVDPQVVAFLDLDGDGDADAVPGGWEFEPIEATAPGTFRTDPTLRWPVYGPGMMSAAVADLDADGWPDLVRSPTGCRPDTTSWRAMFRTGVFRWAPREQALADLPPVNPYVMGVAPLAGQLHVLGLGLACSAADQAPAFFTASSTDSDDYPVFGAADPTPPDARYKLRPVVAGGPISRVNPMGASLGDLDGDGDADLVVTSVHEDLLIFFDDGTLPLRDGTQTTHAALPLRGDDGSGGPLDILKPWGVSTLDVDRDGANDLIVVNGDDHSDWLRDVPGRHRPLLLLRRGARFEEHGPLAGLDLPSDGRSLAIGDLDRDGRPDLLVGGNAELPRVYLNRVDGPRPALAVHLRGTTSGAPATGALVRAFDDGVAADAVVVGGVMSGGATSEPIAFTTTGADGVLDRLEVRWPSGFVQELTGVTAGYVEVVEPETISVLPDSRAARADGASRLTVRCVPRAPDGAPRAAVVDIVAASGTGAPDGPVVQVGDGWERTFVAPTSPGHLIVEVVIDGVPQPIHPRLFWTSR